MRILHTSDWHLGHTLYDQPRSWEQDRFLSWLIDTLEEHAVDAILIAGDIFDTSNPSAFAQAQWYRFLAGARRRIPEIQIVAIGGNHDSAGRLDAPGPVFETLGVTIVGGARANEIDKMLVPLSKGGSVRAWVCAVPFLRPSDLDLGLGGDDPLVEGVRALYGGVFQAARERRSKTQALVAMGHCYFTGTRLSELSERRVLGGNQHALPLDIFPGDVAYAALGHLHLAQFVGENECIRYSGSPIALSMSEADYPHQVVRVDLDGPEVEAIQSIRVPRSVPILRLPEEGFAPLEEVVACLEELEVEEPAEGAPEAWLEARVKLDGPDPTLRDRLDAALEGKPVRLVKISRQQTGGEGGDDRAPRRQLGDLRVDEVFKDCWAKAHGGEPPERLVEAFEELNEEARVKLEEEAA